mgnify:CR=1 FL=1
MKAAKGCKLVLVLLATILISAMPAWAVPVSSIPDKPLGLLLDTPDILSGFIDTSYDAETDYFSAFGFAGTLNDGSGPASEIDDGFFPGGDIRFTVIGSNLVGEIWVASSISQCSPMGNGTIGTAVGSGCGH